MKAQSDNLDLDFLMAKRQDRPAEVEGHGGKPTSINDDLDFLQSVHRPKKLAVPESKSHAALPPEHNEDELPSFDITEEVVDLAEGLKLVETEEFSDKLEETESLDEDELLILPQEPALPEESTASEFSLDLAVHEAEDETRGALEFSEASAPEQLDLLMAEIEAASPDPESKGTEDSDESDLDKSAAISAGQFTSETPAIEEKQAEPEQFGFLNLSPDETKTGPVLEAQLDDIPDFAAPDNSPIEFEVSEPSSGLVDSSEDASSAVFEDPAAELIEPDESESFSVLSTKEDSPGEAANAGFPDAFERAAGQEYAEVTSTSDDREPPLLSASPEDEEELADLMVENVSASSPAPKAGSSPFAQFVAENAGKKLPDASKSKQAPQKEREARKKLPRFAKMLSLLENESSVGLDLGSKSVKSVQIKRSAGSHKVLACDHFPTPLVDIELGTEMFQAAVADALRDHMTSHQRKSSSVTSAVSGMEVVFKNVQIPKMPKKGMVKAVPFACRKDFPFPIESTVFQYRPIGGPAKASLAKLDMFVVAAQRELVHRHLAALKAAEIVPIKLSSVPVALWNVFRLYAKKENLEGTFGIVDFGASSSHIIFINQGDLQFAREISTGGDDFTEVLTGDLFLDGQEVKLDEAQAEKIKQKYGIPGDTDQGKTEDGIALREISVLMGPVVERLVNDVQRTTEFYKERFKVDKIAGFFLTGGGANMPHLPEVLHTQLSQPIQILNPFDVVSTKKIEGADSLYEVGPAFAVAVGLSLDDPKELNLLPPELKGSYFFRYLKRIFRYVCLILVLLMLFLSQHIARKVSDIETEFHRVNRQYRKGEPLRKRFLELQRVQERLLKTSEQYGTSINVDLDAANNLRVISHFFPANMTLTSLRIEHHEEPVEGMENAFTLRKTVLLDGIAFESNSMEGMNLANFLMDLEKSHYFALVKLRSQQIREDGSLQFVIECEL